jgi:hypothetical protein
MNMPRWVSELLMTGTIPESRIPQRDAQEHRHLLQSGIIQHESYRQRNRLRVVDTAALQRWAEMRYTTIPVTADAGIRAQNIARTGQSKAGARTHATQPVLLRMFAPDLNHPWALQTQLQGLAGVLSSHLERTPLPAPWHLLTVENWESFVRITYTPTEATIVVVYTAGQIADETLRSLANLASPASALHFGDIDWSGIDIYRRMRTFLPGLAWYMPPDLAQLLAQMGNHALIAKQSPAAPRHDDSPALQQTLALISEHHAGLEQEAIAAPKFPWG